MPNNRTLSFKDTILVFTDGACRGNQSSDNHGGWGAILTFNKKIKQLNGYEKNTTNNRMELQAIISSLESIKDKSIPIYVFSDSSYVINCFLQGWHLKWKINGWKNSKKEPVENSDLWKKLIELSESFDFISYYRIKGHLNINNNAEFKKWHKKIDIINGITTSEEEYKYLSQMNHQADELANKAIDESGSH